MFNLPPTDFFLLSVTKGTVKTHNRFDNGGNKFTPHNPKITVC